VEEEAMSWPQAFAIVGVAFAFATMAWAFAWMIARTEYETLFGPHDTDEHVVDMRPPKKEQRE
jgi:hypothetical protein